MDFKTYMELRQQYFGTVDYANWMGAEDADFRHRPLCELAIPGSHDALTKDISFPGVEASKAQGSSVYDQLKQGSRYLDLRVSRAKDGKFYGYHGLKWTNYSLDSAISEISRFLSESPDEVLIITMLVDENGYNGTEQEAWGSVFNAFGSEAHDLRRGGSDFSRMSLEDLKLQGIKVLVTGFSSNAFLDRGGIYGEKAYSPEEVESYFKNNVDRMPNDRLWIWHPNPPYYFAGPSLEAQAKTMATYFCDRLVSKNFRKYRFNIINVDFIVENQWVNSILSLNHPLPD